MAEVGIVNPTPNPFASDREIAEQANEAGRAAVAALAARQAATAVGGFLVPEAIHAVLLSSVMTVPNELLAEHTRIDFNRRITPEEQAARDRERQQRADTATRAHTALLADAADDDLAAEMLTLHGPWVGQFSITCQGCDIGGSEGELAEWPCTTYQHVAARYGRRFVEDAHGPRMEVGRR